MDREALQTEYLALLEEEWRARARKSFLAFVLATKPDYQANWHHVEICKALDDFVAGGIKRLMISLPPRHGKSQAVSRQLPAYILGRNPDASIIACSYGADLAVTMNRDVQRIMESPEFQGIFPDTRIPGKNVQTESETTWVRNSDAFQIVDRRGGYRSTGVGGPVTGLGANYCFLGQTKVLSDSGYKPIAEVSVGDLVWSYNHAKNRTELMRVEAISSRVVSSLVQVKTTSGREICCTPEHPFWTETRGYRQAKDLDQWDGVWIHSGLSHGKKDNRCTQVSALRGALRNTKVRLRETFKKGHFRAHLFKKLHEQAQGIKQPEAVPFVWWRAFKKDALVLLETVQAVADKITEYSVPIVRWFVQTVKSFDSLLLDWVQGFPSFQSDEGHQKLKLQARERIPDTIFQTQAVHHAKGRYGMRGLLGHKKDPSSSHRWEQAEQRVGKLNHVVPDVPRHSSQVTRDSISMVKRTGDHPQRVYDLRVEGNHNFFAEGVLVHNCLIDDPIKNFEEAHSQTYRDIVWNWYTSTFLTRLEKNGQILLTMTRWHHDDLAGRLLAQEQMNPEADKWTVIKFPAISDDGKALWPDKYPIERLTQMRASMGSRVWQALYQQEPSLEHGTLIKREWWKFYRDPPARFDEVIQSWDLTFKDSASSDFVVGQVWGRRGAEKYLLDQVRARMDFVATIDAIRTLSAKWPNAHLKLIEDKANGPAVIAALKREITGIVPVDPKASKESRVHAITPQIEAGNVYLPSNAPWVHDFIEECSQFPSGKNDDQCDALTQALSRLGGGLSGEFNDKFGHTGVNTFTGGLSDSW